MKIYDIYLVDFKETVKSWIGENDFKLMEQKLKLNEILLNTNGVKEYKTKVWNYLVENRFIAF